MSFRKALAAIGAAALAVVGTTTGLVVTSGDPPAGIVQPSSPTQTKPVPRLISHLVNPVTGVTLRASQGTWTNSPTSFSYLWEDCDSGGGSCGTAAGSPTNTANYVVVAGDVGHTIKVVVTAANSAGSASQTSAATGLVTAPTGVLLFNGTFDTPVASGTPSPWTAGPQCANYGTPLTTPHYPGDFYFDNGSSSPVSSPGSLFNAASSATVPPGLGTDSARIVLPTTPAGHSLTFCTIHGLATPAPGDVGTTNYYGLMYYLPPAMSLNSSVGQGLNMWEFHFNAVWGAPIALQLHTGGASATFGTGNSVALAIQTGACNAAGTTNPGCQYRETPGFAAAPCNITSAPNIGTVTCLPFQYAQPPGSVQYGTWNELVVQIDEESTPTGSVHTWYKPITSPTWTAGASITGIPTVQWDVTKGCCGFPVKEELEGYTGAQSAPFSINYDEELVGTSLASVENVLPTTGTTPVAPTNSVVPAVSGTTTQGQALSATTGTWAGTPSPSFNYQWQDCDSGGSSCVPAAGSPTTAATYTLVTGDVGHTIRAVVTAQNSAGTASATSTATAVVAASASTGTGASLAECRTGSIVAGTLNTCTAASTTTPSLTFTASVAGAGCPSNVCTASVWIPSSLVTSNASKPVPLVVGYSDASTNQDSEPDWVTQAPTILNNASTHSGYIYLGFPHVTGSYGAQVAYGGTVDQAPEVAAFLSALEAGSVTNPANSLPIQIDTARVFASGGSKGGSMSIDTLCDPTLAGSFTGVAPVSEIQQAASPSGSSADPPYRNGSCPAIFKNTPSKSFTLASVRHPVMVQLVNAKNDSAYGNVCSGGITTECIMGGLRSGPIYYYTPPEQSTLIFGAGYGCSATPISTTAPITNVSVVTYGGCTGGVRVQDIILNSGCHSYSCTGSGPAGFDVARSAWDFFTTGNESPS